MGANILRLGRVRAGRDTSKKSASNWLVLSARGENLVIADVEQGVPVRKLPLRVTESIATQCWVPGSYILKLSEFVNHIPSSPLLKSIPSAVLLEPSGFHRNRTVVLVRLP